MQRVIFGPNHFSKNFQVLFVLLLTSSLGACPSRTPAPTPASPPVSVNVPVVKKKAWDGTGADYCTLKAEVLPGHHFPLLPEHQTEHDPHHEPAHFENHVDELIQAGKYQEAIWFMELHYKHPEKLETLKELLHEILLKGHAVPENRKLGGTSAKRFLRFENGIHGIFKYSAAANESTYWWVNEKAEVAAYLLDQLFHLNLVPMTVLRNIDGHAGSVQYFLDDSDILPGHLEQISAINFPEIKIFDYLIANLDRKAELSNENFLFWKSENYIISIDNGASFGPHTYCGHPHEIKEFLELAPRLKHIVDSTTDSQVIHTLSPYLPEDQIHGLVERLHQIQSPEARRPASGAPKAIVPKKGKIPKKSKADRAKRNRQ